jgi:hypothetical protein
LYQIILNHWGLSLGEIETINSIFNNHDIIETNVSKTPDFASTLEIEFIKNCTEDFFGSIPMGKWSELVEITKNIKKRRGNKGLKLKITITEYLEDTIALSTQGNEKIIEQRQLQYDEVEKELLFCRKLIFLLVEKRDTDFIKGLERIEITIENLTDVLNKIVKSPPLTDEINCEPLNTDIYANQLSTFSQIHLFIFVFDRERRVWKNL